MKRMMVVGLLGCLLVGLLAVAAPISLCDYHTPETSLSDMNLSFNYRYFDDPATEGVDVSSGRFSLGYNQLYDSPVMGCREQKEEEAMKHRSSGSPEAPLPSPAAPMTSLAFVWIIRTLRWPHNSSALK